MFHKKSQRGILPSFAVYTFTIANLSDCFANDIRLDFYDEGGQIVSSVCRNTLGPKQLEYVDLANYGNLPPEWVGGMVVTVVRSENLCEPDGESEPAIAAVIVNRHPDGSASGQESFPILADYAPEDVTDCAPPSSGGATNYAPLLYREFNGWDTEIEVQNLSSSDPALVKVYFLDQSGNTITTMMDWIPSAPPENPRTFVLSSTDTLPGRYYGAVVIQSQDYVDYLGDVVPAPDVSSRVTLREFDTGQVITYDAFSLDQTLGATEIDLPSLIKSDQGRSSEIAVRNNSDLSPRVKVQLAACRRDFFPCNSDLW